MPIRRIASFSQASGSTSGGTALSTIKGAWPDGVLVAKRSSEASSSTGGGAPVAQSSASIGAGSARNESSDRYSAPTRSARVLALLGVRLTISNAVPVELKDSAALSVIDETPMSAMRPGVLALRSRKQSIAISASDTRPSPSRVSPRTRAAICCASSNSSSSAGPHNPSSTESS